MTQEDKELLITDLCSRLSYDVKISVNDKVESLEGINTLDNVAEYGSFLSSDIEEVKPYLFPLSSMNEEQKEELNRITNGKFNSCGTYIDNCKPRNWSEWGTTEYNWIRHHDVDLLHTWLNKNHFDYRGLIEKGLALDASHLNIYNNDTER